MVGNMVDNMVDKIKCEEPCEYEPGKGCKWIDDDGEDDEGNYITWDTYCVNCFRSKDWKLENYKEQ